MWLRCFIFQLWRCMLGSKIEATTPNVGFLLSSVGYSMLFLLHQGQEKHEICRRLKCGVLWFKSELLSCLAVKPEDSGFGKFFFYCCYKIILNLMHIFTPWLCLCRPVLTRFKCAVSSGWNKLSQLLKTKWVWMHLWHTDGLYLQFFQEVTGQSPLGKSASTA